MGQLSTEQCVFVVEIYHRTKSFLKVKEAFYEQYPDTEVPSKSTMQRNVKKYHDHGTSLNRNKNVPLSSLKIQNCS